MNIENAIIQMFHGARGQQDCVPLSKKYKELFDKCLESEENFRKELPTKLLPIFEKTMDDFHNMYVEMLENYYAEGFRFGCLMGIDIMRKTED